MGSNEWLIVLWVAALGGCLGSFLNVVVYRWPAGKSVVAPGSACPHCAHPIRWQHNIPVFGWLLLRGRCHDCGTGISPRYPLVEAAMAAALAGLAWRYLAADPPGNGGAIDWTPRLARFGLFSLLLGTLLASVLIQWDRARLPLRLHGFAVTLAALLLVLLPEIGSPVQHGVGLASLDQAWQGLLLGVLLGVLPAVAGFDRQNLRPRLADAALVGLLLGSTLLALLAVAACAGELLWKAARRAAPRHRPPLPWSAFLLAAVAVVLLLARQSPAAMLEQGPLPVPYLVWLAAPLLCAALAAAGKFLEPPAQVPAN